jgi:ketosteroid isomerase-like protein
VEGLHPEVEWHTAADLPDSGTHHGPGEIVQLFAEWAASFEDFRAEIDEILDGGDEVVVVVVRLRGRPKGGEDEVELPETHVWRLRDGKVIEVREYRTKAEALEAAGLSG